MKPEIKISAIDLIGRAFRHSGKSEYDDLPLMEVVRIILEVIAEEIKSANYKESNP